MPIKLSGPISMQDIVDEFGGDAPHSLNEYYRSGDRVVDANINSGVPTAGQISLEDFYGASKIIYMTLRMFGGGGSGGNGYENGSGTGSGASGKETGIVLKSVYDAKNGAVTRSDFIEKANGGGGGVNGGSNFAGVAGKSGQGVDAGDVDGIAQTGNNSGGALNTAAPTPTFARFSSGGGGGGGDLSSDGGSFLFIGYGGGDAAGAAGGGGNNGDFREVKIEIDTGVDYVLVLGGGGARGGPGNHLGAVGVAGFMQYKVETDGSSSEWTEILVPSRINNNRSDFTRSRAYDFKLDDTGAPTAPVLRS